MERLLIFGIPPLYGDAGRVAARRVALRQTFLEGDETGTARAGGVVAAASPPDWWEHIPGVFDGGGVADV